MGSIPTSSHHEGVNDLIVARSASVYVTLRSLEARLTVYETWDDDWKVTRSFHLGWEANPLSLEHGWSLT